MMKIGDRVEVIGDCNDELLGKTGKITDVLVMDLDIDIGWRAATPEDIRKAEDPDYEFGMRFFGSWRDLLPRQI